MNGISECLGIRDPRELPSSLLQCENAVLTMLAS